MEIKNYDNKNENEYPKMEQVSKEDLVENTPSKWIKIGISVVGLITLVGMSIPHEEKINSTLYTTTVVIAPRYLSPVHKILDQYVFPITQRTSFIVFVVTGLCMLINRHDAKKYGKDKKGKKWVRILFIASIVLFIVNLIIRLNLVTKV